MTQKLYILNIPEIEKIFNEIKEYTTFEVAGFKKIKDLVEKLENDKDILLNSIVLIYKKDAKSIEGKIDENKICYLPNLPFKILYLLEQINVKFIQQVYISQSDINVKNYALDLNARILKKNNQELKLTEREIEAIIFLQNKNEPVSVEKLQKEVWKYGEDLETHTVETHIYRLRKKIKDKFNDNNFILSEKKGYFIK
tara:strand:+ start:408 stop:1001 length:594 start_codon:yes stop_codon:yes gene_type:complete